MTKFNKNMMQDGASRMRNFIKAHNRLPKYLKMTDSEGIMHELNNQEYAGLYEAEYGFWKVHGREPNYTTFYATAHNPLNSLHQPNIWTCCPTSVAMCSQMLYNYKSITECKKLLGTIEKGEIGTSPSKLVNNIHKLGMKATVIDRSLDAVKDSLNKCRPIVAHIETAKYTKPKCLGFKKNYGHYICIYGYSGNYYYVCDPTKGLKTCLSSEINKATNSRDINYYSVSLL
jgi:hypothetical protein